jgi:hypothetical protein
MRCINPAQLTKDSRNLKSVALKTAEISSTQISTNARTATSAISATPRDRRKFGFLASKVLKHENLQQKKYVFLQVKPILSIFHKWKVKMRKDAIKVSNLCPVT